MKKTKCPVCRITLPQYLLRQHLNEQHTKYNVPIDVKLRLERYERKASLKQLKRRKPGQKRLKEEIIKIVSQAKKRDQNAIDRLNEYMEIDITRRMILQILNPPRKGKYTLPQFPERGWHVQGGAPK